MYSCNCDGRIESIGQETGKSRSHPLEDRSNRIALEDFERTLRGRGRQDKVRHHWMQCN